MDAGTADTINRLEAEQIAKSFDEIDAEMGLQGRPELQWFNGSMADTLMGDNDSTDADRAWLVGALAARIPGLQFDGAPADGDWENLYSHLRTQILARRDPKIPPAGSAAIRPRCVV